MKGRVYIEHTQKIEKTPVLPDLTSKNGRYLHTHEAICFIRQPSWLH